MATPASTLSQEQDWNAGAKSGLLSIGSHSLYLSVSGPTRKPNEPIVVLMQGLGASLHEWVSVRALLPNVRWLQYDRTGLGLSELPPTLSIETLAAHSIPASSVAAELSLLLKAAKIAPPYLIVAHSWGGLTSREFLHLHPDDVAGILFVDANQENHFYYRRPHEGVGVYYEPWHKAVDKDVSYLTEGAMLERDALKKLPAASWAASEADRDKEQHTATMRAEYRAWATDGPTLAEKNQFAMKPLGNKPVVVLRADSKLELERMYAAGVAKGNGTEEERRQYRELIEQWEEQDVATQKEMLKLSSVGKFTNLKGSLHCIQMTHPEAVAEEVMWLLEKIKGGSSQRD